MSNTRGLYRKDTYKGEVIMDDKRRKRGKVTGFYKSMLDGLFKMGEYAKHGSGFVRPTAVTLSFAFTEESSDYPISKVMIKIWNTFSKSRLPTFDDDGKKVQHGRTPANCFKPLYLWCRETKYLDAKSPELDSLTPAEREQHLQANRDECPRPYDHVHVLLILDDAKGSWLAVKNVMDSLVETGVVRRGFHFSKESQTKRMTLDLKDDDDYSQFIYRGAYLAKVDTKNPSGERMWSFSRCTRKKSNPVRRKSK